MRTRTRVRHCRKCAGVLGLAIAVVSLTCGLIAGVIQATFCTEYWWVQFVLLMPAMLATRYLDRTVERAHWDGHPGLREREADRDVPSLGRHASVDSFPTARHWLAR
jgi:hypothetical protein